jgi:hypothetical protein
MEVCEFECEIGLTSGGGLSGIDVADNDDVDVHLFLTGKKRSVSQESIKIGRGCIAIDMMDDGAVGVREGF